MNTNYSLSELSQIAKKLIENSKSTILLFYGDMGVGKTTLIKELCKQLGINDLTSSPTFSLVNEYHSKNNDVVYHFDFYRIEHEEEALDMGIEEYFYSNAWCFIEWPENIQNLVPLKSTEIHLTELSDGQRNIQLKQTV